MSASAVPQRASNSAQKAAFKPGPTRICSKRSAKHRVRRDQANYHASN